MTVPETFEVTLTTLTYGGDCMGRLPDGCPRAGLAVFVPYALPGEKVRARIVEEKRGHVRAELLEVLSPSPDRITPRCPHFYSPLTLSPIPTREAEGVRACGGCHYQHMSYPAQLAAKTTILRDQLERIGHIPNPPLQAILPSPNPWNYRNHIQFHLSAQGQLGFETRVRAGSKPAPTIIPIQECHLPEAALNVIWPQLDLEAIPGLERVGLRLGADDEVMLTLESAEPLEFSVEDLPISAVQLGPAGPTGPAGAMVLAGSEYLVMEIHGRPFRVSAASFFQVNTPLAAVMVDHVLANLHLSPSTTALDLYCGVGLFSAFLAPRVARLIGVEVSPSACEDFVVNLDEFDHVELYEAAVEDTLPELKLQPDVILLDPPRAGVDRRALAAILALESPAIAYISCDPATLARDARRLTEGGYSLRGITPFDVFPQTYHIESISFWER